MFGLQKVIRPTPDLPDFLLWSCNICILTINQVTDFLRGSVICLHCREMCVIYLSPKAEGLSVNFSNVTASSNFQMYASPQCVTSGSLVQYSCQCCHKHAS